MNKVKIMANGILKRERPNSRHETLIQSAQWPALSVFLNTGKRLNLVLINENLFFIYY